MAGRILNRSTSPSKLKLKRCNEVIDIGDDVDCLIVREVKKKRIEAIDSQGHSQYEDVVLENVIIPANDKNKKIVASFEDECEIFTAGEESRAKKSVKFAKPSLKKNNKSAKKKSEIAKENIFFDEEQPPLEDDENNNNNNNDDDDCHQIQITPPRKPKNTRTLPRWMAKASARVKKEREIIDLTSSLVDDDQMPQEVTAPTTTITAPAPPSIDPDMTQIDENALRQIGGDDINMNQVKEQQQENHNNSQDQSVTKRRLVFEGEVINSTHLTQDINNNNNNNNNATSTATTTANDNNDMVVDEEESIDFNCENQMDNLTSAELNLFTINIKALFIDSNKSSQVVHSFPLILASGADTTIAELKQVMTTTYGDKLTIANNNNNNNKTTTTTTRTSLTLYYKGKELGEDSKTLFEYCIVKDYAVVHAIIEHQEQQEQEQEASVPSCTQDELVSLYNRSRRANTKTVLVQPQQQERQQEAAPPVPLAAFSTTTTTTDASRSTASPQQKKKKGKATAKKQKQQQPFLGDAHIADDTVTISIGGMQLSFRLPTNNNNNNNSGAVAVPEVQ